MDDYDTYERDDGPPYANIDTIQGSEIPAALNQLALFDGDPYLRMQAYNLAIVDTFLNQLEQNVMCRLFDEERTPIDDAMFLSAQSQMWIFAAYEVMRTWRQRVKDVLKLHVNGGLQQKIASLEKEEGFLHYGKLHRADMLKEVIERPQIIDQIDADLKKTHVMFKWMEALRIMLAKHEVSGKANSIAMSPGYGRINRWCGSLDYELNNGKYIMGNTNRRDIANSIRAISLMEEVPTAENLASFDAFMKGPAS